MLNHTKWLLKLPKVGEKIAGLVVAKWHTTDTTRRIVGFGKVHHDICVTYVDGTDEFFTVEYAPQASVPFGAVNMGMVPIGLRAGY